MLNYNHKFGIENMQDSYFDTSTVHSLLFTILTNRTGMATTSTALAYTATTQTSVQSTFYWILSFYILTALFY